MEQLNSDLSSKLRGANFFVTGGSQAQVGLNFNFIPFKGVNLSSDGQTLQESYSIAAQVFERAAPKTIKFVIIGLPLNFGDEAAKFLTDAAVKEMLPILGNYFKLCFDNGARPVVVTFPVEKAFKKTFNADNLKQFTNAVKEAGKGYKLAFIDLLGTGFADDCFSDKTLLNSVGATAASALITARLYSEKIIALKKVLGMDNDYFGVLSKYFLADYKNLTYHVFCKVACNDFKRLSETMPADECKDLMARVFAEMTYAHLVNLSDMLPKDDYNDIAARVFEISAEKIRRKDKIKVGFVLYDSSMWCGDEIYNFFARDERFEPTVFLCLRANQELVKKDFFHGVEQFKSRGLNVVPVTNRNEPIPEQDLIIFLTPYFSVLAKAFRPENLPVKILMAYIPYALSISQFRIFKNAVFCAGWKAFFQTAINLEIFDNKCKVGMPRGSYGGYPKMDIFFRDDADFKFDWKMAQPDAKKIIWAPHWSIQNAVKYATFQWNYKFMYEFAKAHPEISWVVKPHPNLFLSAIKAGLFPSVKAFEEYLTAWNDLPNAQVYTGAYYQAIFKTSDGMIHDSGSFIAEYQYVNKPMIYLTRDTQKFNELGEAVLKVSYLVDGKDLDAIAAMMQRVFIDGDDYRAAERKDVFDKYLNYPKTNGMLASEFIYKSIADELKAI